jgi:hypothetical protein
LLALLCLSTAVSAKRIAIPPLTDRIAGADCVVVGKVTSVGLEPGKPGFAVLRVEEVLLGAKGLKDIHISFSVPGQLQEGQEVCVLLKQGKAKDNFLAPRFFGVFQKSEPNFKAQYDVVKRATGLMVDPDPTKALQGKDAADRLLGAALLLGKYRPAFQAAQKQEPIDAGQSRLILQALADADWSKADPVTGINPQQLFFRLGLTPADGWSPTDFQKFEQTAKAWLKANAGTYRVKRFVTGGK